MRSVANEKAGVLSMPNDYAVMMKSSSKYKWFKPLLALAIGGILLVLFTSVVAVIGEVLKVPGFASLGVGSSDSYLNQFFGGIEVTICLHACNNVVSMMLSTMYASAASTVSTTPGYFVLNIAFEFITFAAACYLCKRNGYFIKKAYGNEAVSQDQLPAN